MRRIYKIAKFILLIAILLLCNVFCFDSYAKDNDNDKFSENDLEKITITFDPGEGSYNGTDVKSVTLRKGYSVSTVSDFDPNSDLVAPSEDLHLRGWKKAGDESGEIIIARNADIICSSENVTYVAVWAKYIQVTYKYSGASDESGTTISIFEGDSVYFRPEPETKEGYALYGYKIVKGEDLGKEIPFEEIYYYVPKSDIVLEYIFKQGYTVTFDANGSTISGYNGQSSVQVNELAGSHIKHFQYDSYTPDMYPGHYFEGYRVKGSVDDTIYYAGYNLSFKEGKKSLADYVVNSDVTFEAVWSPAYNVHITADKEILGSDYDFNIIVKQGYKISTGIFQSSNCIQSPSAYPDYTCIGYEVQNGEDEGLILSEAYKNNNYVNNYVPKYDVELKAVMAELCELSFDYNGGIYTNTYSGVEFLYNDTLYPKNCRLGDYIDGNWWNMPEKEGYYIFGYQLNDTETIMSFKQVEDYIIPGDTKFTVIWKENSNYPDLDNTVFSYEKNDDESLTITGLKDNTTVINSFVIPSEIDGKPVVKIGENAFNGCTGLTGNLEIPDSIGEIGNYAFYGCNGLSGNLVIPDSVEKIGEYAFDGLYNINAITNSSEISIPAYYFINENSKEFFQESKTDILRYRDDTLTKGIWNRKNESTIYVKTIELNLDEINLEVGKSSKLTATVLPDDATNKNIEWSSSNNEIATVDSNGVITSIKPGTVNIKVTSLDSGNVYAICKIIVRKNEDNNMSENTEKPSGKTTTPNQDSHTGPVKKTQTIKGIKNITKNYSNKSFKLSAATDGNGKISYISSNKKVATVSSDGKVKLIGAGKTKITVKASGTSSYTPAEKTITLTVKRSKQKITSKVKTKTMTYTSTPFNLGTKVQGNAKVTYKSSNPKVLTVSSKGKVTLKGIGKATITIKTKQNAKYAAGTKKIVITVKAPKVKLLKCTALSDCRVRLSWKSSPVFSGYEIQLSQDSKFSDKYNPIDVKQNISSTILRGGAEGRTYYVRIRPYKKVNGKKVTYAWSNVSSFKAFK